MEAMRFFNRHWQGNDTAAGSLPVLDSSNVYTWVLSLEGSLAFHFTSPFRIRNPVYYIWYNQKHSILSKASLWLGLDVVVSSYFLFN